MSGLFYAGAAALLHCWPLSLTHTHSRTSSCTADKHNLDFAHPWCASPAFTIQQGTVGATPVSPGWAQWRLAPQPSALSSFSASVPTPGGLVPVEYAAAYGGGGGSNATVSLAPAAGQLVQVCLGQPGTEGDQIKSPSSDVLSVDGVQVAVSSWGRFLCAQQALGAGPHVVSRITKN